MSKIVKNTGRRVVLAYWKVRRENAFEVFSNLLLFCKSYPAYNYNTLNNYLSKEKIAFENDSVRVERMPLLNRPIPLQPAHIGPFKMTHVVRTSALHEIDEKKEDLAYWLSRSPEERIAAVTFIVLQSLKAGQRMNRSIVQKRKMKDHAIE